MNQFEKLMNLEDQLYYTATRYVNETYTADISRWWGSLREIGANDLSSSEESEFFVIADMVLNE